MKRFRNGLALLALGIAGVTTALAYPALAAHSTSKTVTIKVTATEWKFKLSRSSVPVGTTVVFQVTNKGKIGHDFKINGKKTPLINPGQTKSIKVVFKKKGTYGYLCTVTGHARLGMQGKFAVGVKSVVTTTTATTTSTTVSTTVGGGGPCNSPTTIVNVQMKEYTFLFNGSPNAPALSAGCIQFNISNVGNEVHNFDISGVKAGTLLAPGGNETWAVNLKAGQYLYVCDVPFHVDRGMTGNFTVS